MATKPHALLLWLMAIIFVVDGAVASAATVLTLSSAAGSIGYPYEVSQQYDSLDTTGQHLQVEGEDGVWRMYDGVMHQFAGVADALSGASWRTAARGASGVGDALKGLRAGRSSGVKVVDSADELNGLFGRLSSGGKAVEGSTYPGQMVKLPDGTTVGLRTGSKSGGPTIDIKLPDGTRQKIHVQQ